MLEQIDSLAGFFLSLDGAPGISIAVLQNADTIALKGYGVANAELGHPVTRETRFQLASLTKMYTAAAVMKLVEEGVLGLDTTVRQILPDYRGAGQVVTIHQLLSHSSGIPNYHRSTTGTEDLRHIILSRGEVLAIFEDSLQFEPGSAFRYSNGGYYLLGLIIEETTGESYADFVKRAVLDPVGLQHTGVCGQSTAAQFALGHEHRLGRLSGALYVGAINFGASGAICSTALEVAVWIRALAAGEVVSTSSFQQMITNGSGHSPIYGLGFGLGEFRGHTRFGHVGSFTGFNAVVAHYPSLDLTIAVLANGPLAAEIIEREIADIAIDAIVSGDGQPSER